MQKEVMSFIVQASHKEERNYTPGYRPGCVIHCVPLYGGQWMARARYRSSYLNACHKICHKHSHSYPPMIVFHLSKPSHPSKPTWGWVTVFIACITVLFILYDVTGHYNKDSGPRLNIKTVLSTYGDFHVKDKTAVRTSYL